MFKKTTTTLLSVMLLAASAAEAENYDIYLLAGQSNADGRGEISDLTGDLARFAAPQTEHRIAFTNPGDSEDAENPDFVSGWQTLEPGYSIEPGFDGPLLGDTFGPEVSFAEAISEATATDNRVGIVKVTRGGSNLRQDWNPNDDEGFLYDLLINQAEAALAALAAEGNTGTIRGLIWHQGESDTGGGSEALYEERFLDFVDQLRSDLAVPDLPVVIGELAPGRSDSFSAIQEGIASASLDDGIGFASSAGLNAPDGTHFDAASQIELGQRFAESLATLIVPEPGTMAVFCVSAIALVTRRTRC